MQQGKGTLEVEKVQGVRNLGKKTRGDLLFLERLQPNEQQKRAMEKSVEYFVDRKVPSHCTLSGFERHLDRPATPAVCLQCPRPKMSRELVLPDLHVAQAR